MRPNILNIGLFYFWFLGFKFQNLEDKGGGYYDPPYIEPSAKFYKKSLLYLERQGI